MAKRTKLTAPSAEDLAKLDADFRSENLSRPNRGAAPIAQVAAESAALSTGENTQNKVNRIDAERLRAAEENGLILTELATTDIIEDAMIRDRAVLDLSEMNELKLSIHNNGLRLPIEVYAAGDGKFALISGYRRLKAVRELAATFEDAKYATIKAIVRPKTETADAFAAMVEENEVRSNLSHFERGRIAVIAAQQGAFPSTEDAVNKMFMSASAAKRSKVKAFAEVFEILGDMLQFPEKLSERRGLRLSNALRQGSADVFRAALGAGQGVTPDLEWAVLLDVIEGIEAGPVKVAKRGRPKAATPAGWENDDTLHLTSGVTLRKESTADGFAIHVTGKHLSPDLISSAMNYLRYAFETPET